MQPKNDQHFWNFAFSVLYALLLAVAVYDIYERTGVFALYLTTLDLIVIPLAVFRIVRLFTYDKIMEWFRDLFKKKVMVKGSDGAMNVEYVSYQNGPLKTMSELLACPWCTGVWAALAVVYLYFAVEWFWLPLFILAVAGVGSFLQLIANAIGWRAEKLKLEAQEK